MLNPRELIYETTLKQLFFRLNPENAHELSKSLLMLANSLPFVFPIIEKLTTYESKRLQVEIAGIQFNNPLGMAAGFDKTGELYPFLAKLGFGHVEIGTITGEEQPGNPKPRIFRYEKQSALVNRMGFNNPGSEKAFETISKQTKKIPRGINVGKTKLVAIENAVQDYVKSFKKLSSLGDYGVINISSPNTPGLRSFQEKDSFISLIKGIKEGLGGEFLIPTFIKLAPDLDDKSIEELLDVILDFRLAGVILTNTTIDKTTLSKYSKVEEGGISGLPVQKRSTEVIRLAYKKLKGRLPIIGVGGIDSGEAALEKIQAGANLFQIYTGYIYKGPLLPYSILEYLDRFMIRQGVSKISELVGTSSK
ncbi:MAG TPA: quinone-dependent dihydroorotate dehydrogenase [Leptospiraceae bacterium]|nr:quinone-dependent dihydroorotate dehydrogenase [Leptospiraceae bacterium]HMW06400.1 quinone-dependent dihydroorotate dehydrogenase [Leptospiraceae bacterium]HMX31688.1 quinone-dependent dihydroorotate dehydrogenase [Leptospiraceae bacterium]HMY31974.1 quinone-dependent dihydroorotate dehydrogenase [Leptospiraceae bacterium]HMZ63162.1 quinone-dependent dihydroorotate dehydrogenase [Leptospiraceae bacterium]